MPHQQQSSTNQWDLLSGERISCFNGKSHWPDHTPQHGHLRSYRDGLSFHPFPPPPQMFASCLIGMGSWDPRGEVTATSPCLAVWRVACGGRGGQGAVPGVWKYLPRVDPALMFFWHPSDSRPCTKWISELILWGDKIMGIVLPKIMKYHIMSAFYHWFECILRKLNVTKTQDIFGNCMLSSNCVWIFIQALFYELYKML